MSTDNNEVVGLKPEASTELSTIATIGKPGKSNLSGKLALEAAEMLEQHGGKVDMGMEFTQEDIDALNERVEAAYAKGGSGKLSVADQAMMDELFNQIQENQPKGPVLPTAEQIADMKAMRKEQRLYARVWEHVQKEGNTLREEYELIKDKESEMSRSMRDYLVALMEYVPTEEEIAANEARSKRIEAQMRAAAEQENEVEYNESKEV